MRRRKAVVLVLASALVLVAGAGSAETLGQTPTTSNEATQQPCEEPGSFDVAAAKGQQAPSEDVQDRAVPRTKVPGGAAPQTKGVVVEGNRLRALPGFVLESGPNNQVAVRRAGGLGATTFQCSCSGNGTCTSHVGPDTALCYKDTGDTCNSACQFITTTKGFGGGGYIGRDAGPETTPPKTRRPKAPPTGEVK